MIAKLFLAGSIGIAALPAGAFAAEQQPSLRKLLADGYEVKSTTVIPAEIAKRMAKNDTWTDDLMMILQKGGGLAICHFTLTTTVNPQGFLDLPCAALK